MKIALITGITGMDGSYLTELLLSKPEYVVHGIIRRSSSINTHRISHLYQDPHDINRRLFLHYGDLTDTASIENIITVVQPDEVYNLAAMSHVKVSFEMPEYTFNVNSVGTVRILEALRKLKKPVKFYQAGTSEMFGGLNEQQSEKTQFNPKSPYAISKLSAYWSTKNYREAYGLYACNGILFNHTSHRRGHTFVEKKIVEGAVNIKYGKTDKLYLGNLYSFRDIGHSKDYCYAIWLMLQQTNPDDYVIATGHKYMIKDIVNMVFDKLDMKIVWRGEGINEIGFINDIARIHIDSRYFRPTEVESLCGDFSKAYQVLGWEPKYDLDTILTEMIEYSIANI